MPTAKVLLPKTKSDCRLPACLQQVKKMRKQEIKSDCEKWHLHFQNSHYICHCFSYSKNYHQINGYGPQGVKKQCEHLFGYNRQDMKKNRE